MNTIFFFLEQQRKAEKDKAAAASTQNYQVPAGVTPDRVMPSRSRLVRETGVVEPEDNSFGSAFNPSTFEKFDANKFLFLKMINFFFLR